LPAALGAQAQAVETPSAQVMAVDIERIDQPLAALDQIDVERLAQQSVTRGGCVFAGTPARDDKKSGPGGPRSA